MTTDAHRRPTDARNRWTTPCPLLHSLTSEGCSRGGGPSRSQRVDCLPNPGRRFAWCTPCGVRAIVLFSLQPTRGSAPTGFVQSDLPTACLHLPFDAAQERSQRVLFPGQVVIRLHPADRRGLMKREQAGTLLIGELETRATAALLLARFPCAQRPEAAGASKTRSDPLLPSPSLTSRIRPLLRRRPGPSSTCQPPRGEQGNDPRTLKRMSGWVFVPVPGTDPTEWALAASGDGGQTSTRQISSGDPA